MKSRSRTSGGLVLAICVSAAYPASAEAERCTLQPGPLATVVAVIDAETLKLDDGSDVRLIGALAPRAADAGADPGQWPPENAAAAFLKDMTLGKRVRLAYGGRREDRYRRKLAHVFMAAASDGRWVQGAMLQAGMARRYGIAENFACAHELDAHEREARTARRGLWSNYIYAPKRGDRPSLLMRLRFRYARIEGVVSSVSATRSAIYVNFGDNWREDFTARALSAVTSAHDGFTAKLKALEGKRVAVTGWIERNNGPMIELADPSQIATIDDDEDATPEGAMPGALAPSSARPSDSAGEQPKQSRPTPSETGPGGVDL